MGILEKMKDAIFEASDVEGQSQSMPIPERHDNGGPVDVPAAFETSENVTGGMTIEEIYRNAHLTGEDNIFKAEMISKTMPESLPVDIKRQTVLNILQISNLDVSLLIQDAGSRVHAIDAAMRQFAAETNDIISGTADEVEQLKTKIEELNKIILDRQKLQQETEKIIAAEVKHIWDITKFIDPEAQL